MRAGAAGVVRYVAVGGTWSFAGSSVGQWYDPQSPWARYARARGCAPILDDQGRPFVWSSNANGWQAWRRLLGAQPTLHDWQAGARNLYAWLVPPMHPGTRAPGARTHLVTHSHGVQVAIIAAAEGLRINTLIDICGPVRDDVLDRYGAAARTNIGYWLSVHSDATDRWQWLGAVGDGRWGIERRNPLADNWHAIPKAGHSRVLRDPAWFHPWDAWLDLMRRRDGDTEGFAA